MEALSQPSDSRARAVFAAYVSSELGDHAHPDEHRRPCAVLDSPPLDRFVEELRQHHYDIVASRASSPIRAKVKNDVRPGAAMPTAGHNCCRRATSPTCRNSPGPDRRRPYRPRRRCAVVPPVFSANPLTAPLRHPLILFRHWHAAAWESRSATSRADVAATVIPSVGCPMGCNFCSTSAMFGGKGKFVNFYETGDELFDVMDQIGAAQCTCARFSSWTKTSCSIASGRYGSWN